MPKVNKKTLNSEEMLSSAVKAAPRATRQLTLSASIGRATSKSTASGGNVKARANADVVDAIAPKEKVESVPEGPIASSSTSQTKVTIKSTLDTLEKDTMGETWYKALSEEFAKPYFKKLKEFLVTEHASHTVYPAARDIYSWSRYTSLEDVKVVIIGQDPYHDVGQAHGLSFSVLPPTKPPASLKNIYKQLAVDFDGFMPSKTSGDLSPVASQGVLWLNTSLTVRAHKAGSHSNKGWEIFTTQVLRTVLDREDGKQGVVFMAWGLPAQKTCAKLGIDKKKHLLLQSAHPSPLSAHKGFLGNGHFRLANEWLVSKYGKEAEIEWMVLSAKK